MASEESIRNHTALLDRLLDQFNRSIPIRAVVDRITELGLTQDTVLIANAMEPLRVYAENFGSVLNRVFDSIVETNRDTIPNNPTPSETAAANTVKNQAIAAIQNQIEKETLAVIGIVVLAAIAGSLSTDLIAQTRKSLRDSKKRIAVVATDSLFRFNTVITRLRAEGAGIKSFRYSGSIIANSRDFCRRHVGKTYTEKEIATIWKTNWGGKSPGDPMVVRGGYNCRHHWIPVEN